MTDWELDSVEEQKSMSISRPRQFVLRADYHK